MNTQFRRKPKTFINPEIVNEMINLRLHGCLSYRELACKYKVMHTTIIYHCRKAGILIPPRVKERLIDLLKEGLTEEEISEILKMPRTVVHLYCYLQSHPSRGKGDNQASSDELEPQNEIPSKITSTLPAILLRTDQRGISWVDDGVGGWICVGTTEKQKKINLAFVKKKKLEQKRIEMLIY